MKKILFFSITLFCIHFNYAQEIKIKIKNVNDNKITLFSLEGEKISLIDSMISNSTNKFQFNLVSKHSGFYRLTFNKNKWLDLIYDNKDIELETDANNILDSLKIIKSESNKIYYEFVKLNKVYKTKTELLFLILARYPKEDDFYQITKAKLIKVQEEYLYFVNATVQSNSNSLIARYVKSLQLPIIDLEIQIDKQLDYLKAHSLDNVNFNDDDLIYSDAFTIKTIEYLAYYRNPQLPIELLEKEYIRGIDTVLNKAKVSEIVYKHIVEYLLDGFNKIGFDGIIKYIVENYVIKDDLCLDETLEIALEKRIKQTKNLKTGDIVPNIVLPDTSGSTINLSEIHANNTLIIFYASWCPHCKTLIPQVYEYFKNQKEKIFDVLAISIDTSKIDWLNFLNTNNINWMNVSDLKGWEGKAAIDYFIYAIPTMFFVDKNRKLIGMPKNIEEIRNVLN